MRTYGSISQAACGEMIDDGLVSPNTQRGGGAAGTRGQSQSPSAC